MIDQAGIQTKSSFRPACGRQAQARRDVGGRAASGTQAGIHLPAAGRVV